MNRILNQAIILRSILLSVFLLGNSYTMYAQADDILLSNYTFAQDREEVGKISSASGTLTNIKIKGRHAGSFSINNNVLFIKPRFIKQNRRWYDIAIEAEKSDRTVTSAFRIVNDQFNKNKVIAHRGAWKNTGASENSVAALKHAIKLGCQGSEFDIHMSSDSVLFINHDADFEGFAIEKTHSDQLRKLKLKNGENLPTLEEYIKAGIKQNRTKLIFEIKPASSKSHAIAAARKVMMMVRKFKAQAWADYISFDYNQCKELLRMDPYVHVAYLKGDKSPQELATDKMWGFDYNFNVLKKNQNWIEQATQLNLTTNVWTVNDIETMNWMLNKGVTFITTNEPEMLLDLVKKK